MQSITYFSPPALLPASTLHDLHRKLPYDIIPTKEMEKHLVEQKDEAPWTIQQTFWGIIIIVVPWLLLNIGLNSLSGTSPAHPTQLSLQEDITNAVGTFFFSSLIEGAFLLVPWYFAIRASHAVSADPSTSMASQKNRSILVTPRAGPLLGFRRFPVRPMVIWVGVLLLAILGVNLLYQEIATFFHLNLQTNDQVVLARSKYAPITTYALLLVAVFVAPFCEEVFFRGFVFPGLCRGMSVGWAILFSALIFAVTHADPASFPILVAIGLALAFLRWRSKSLWPGILLHMLNNGLGALLIILAMNGVLRL